MGFIRVYLQKMRHGVRLEAVRELARQYPVFCFLLVILLLSTVLLNRSGLTCPDPSRRYCNCLYTGSTQQNKSLYFYTQISSHTNGVLVVSGWSGDVLLFSWTRVAAAQRPNVY